MGVLGSIVVGKWLVIKEFGLLVKGTEGSEALADFVRGLRQVVPVVPLSFPVVLFMMYCLVSPSKKHSNN